VQEYEAQLREAEEFAALVREAEERARQLEAEERTKQLEERARRKDGAGAQGGPSKEPASSEADGDRTAPSGDASLAVARRWTLTNPGPSGSASARSWSGAPRSTRWRR